MSLHNAEAKAKLKGLKTAFKVLDSIQEDGAKLVEMSKAGAAMVRATQPGLRVAPDFLSRIAEKHNIGSI